MRTNSIGLLRLWLGLLCGGLFSNPVFAIPTILHWTTQNGAKVYFVAAPEIPMVDVQVVFDAGAARDGKQLGLAVLTNALLAEGAGTLSSDQISEAFASLGARFGNSAQRDMAIVTLRSLTDPAKLEPALDLLTTVLSQPTFPADAFERERNRVLISIQQRKESPGELSDEAFYEGLYPNHPYGSLPLGKEATVKALALKDLSDFYHQYYVGKNAIVAIVGALDRTAAEKLAEQVMGRLPAGGAAPAVPPVPVITQARTIEIDYPSAQTHITVGQPGMKRGDPDYFTLYVGNHILGGSGLVSRLSDEIREKRGLSYSTSSNFTPMRENGPYELGLQTRTETAAEALALLLAEIKKYVEQGPTEKELQAAIRNITGGFPLRIASNSSIVAHVGMIGFYGLPLDYLDTFNKKIAAVTVKDIKDAFQRRINPDKMVTVLVGKNNAKPTTKDAKVDSKKPS